MNTVKVCEGLEVTNVDRAELKRMHETSNTIETGADAILIGLDDYIDNLLARYEYEPKVPYEKLFYALKQIISSACDNESVRDAVMVGLINKTGEIPVAKKEPKEVKKEEVVKKEPKERKQRNKSAICKYAKTHTLEEIQTHFGFSCYDAARSYVTYHKISFVHRTSGPKAIVLDEAKVRSLAKDMRLCELTRVFSCSKFQMMDFCRKNQIEYKRVVK